MHALILNCTLKTSPQESNTDGLISRVTDELERLGWECETLRPVDYDLKPGTSSDMGDGDEWPKLLAKVQAADALIIGTPVWLGWQSSVGQRVLERLDAAFHEEELWDKDTGQYYTYNKVAGIVVTGNEDGAHACHARLAYALSELGFTVPANPATYWVGEAGPGESYLKATERRDTYSNKMALMLANNLNHVASLLAEWPYPTNLNELKQRAEQMSRHSKQAGQ